MMKDLNKMNVFAEKEANEIVMIEEELDLT